MVDGGCVPELLGQRAVSILRYTAITTIAKVEQRWEKQRRKGTVGVGDKADMVDVSLGWWVVTVAPGPYAFCVGEEKPDIKVGDPARLILEVGL